MAITTTYKNIAIEYDERRDKWNFVLFGKERSADTLSNAKRAIDAPAPKENKNFVPTKAIFKMRYGISFEVIVSSEVEAGTHYWVKFSDGRRSKESATNLYAFGPANVLLCNEAAALNKQADTLRRQANAKYAEMAPFRGLEEVSA